MRCLAPVPLVTSMNLSPMMVSEVVSAVESSLMLGSRSRPTLMVTLITRLGSLEPESSTRVTLPTPMQIGIGGGFGGGIVVDAGQPVAPDAHGDFDNAIGLIGTGKFHPGDLADADAIHAHGRTGRNAGGIRQIEVDLNLGLQEGAAGEQEGQGSQNQQSRRNHGGSAKLRPIDLTSGRHSLRIVPRASRVTQVTMKASPR